MTPLEENKWYFYSHLVLCTRFSPKIFIKFASKYKFCLNKIDALEIEDKIEHAEKCIYLQN